MLVTILTLKISNIGAFLFDMKIEIGSETFKNIFKHCEVPKTFVQDLKLIELLLCPFS